MMMFGGVPISVIMPPSIEPKAIGISSMAGGRPRSVAVASATGSMIARAPTLFMKEEASATTPVRMAM